MEFESLALFREAIPSKMGQLFEAQTSLQFVETLASAKTGRCIHSEKISIDFMKT